MSTNDEFDQIIIARDLVRRPEIRFLAGCIYNLATGTVVGANGEIPAVYVMIAHRIMTKPGAKQLLIQAMEMIS